MKKILFVLLFCLTMPTSIMAQKGMQGFGVNVPFYLKDGNTWTGVGLKYMYNFSDYIRLEPSVNYTLFNSNNKKDYSEFDATLNTHVFFSAPTPTRLYFLGGVGFSKIKENWGATPDRYYRDTSFIVDGGFGLDCRLSHGLSLQIEVAAVWFALGGYADDCGDNNDGYGSRSSIMIKPSIGLTYNF